MNSIDNCDRTQVTKPLTNGESHNATRDLTSYSFSQKSVSVIDGSVESRTCVSVAEFKSTKAEFNESLAKVECNTRLYHPSLPKDNVKNSDLSHIKAEVKTESNSVSCDTNSTTFTPNLSPGTYLFRLTFYLDIHFLYNCFTIPIRQYTICSRSLDPIYNIVTYCITFVKTSWKYRTSVLTTDIPTYPIFSKKITFVTMM